VVIRAATISRDNYAEIFNSYSGSFACHPETVRLLSSLANIYVDYIALMEDKTGIILGALPRWGGFVAVTHAALQARNARSFLDIGDSEVMLPLAVGSSIHLPLKASFISEITARRVTNARKANFQFTFAKSLLSQVNPVSTKFRKNRLYETRKVLEQGAIFVPVNTFSANELAAEYSRLFEKRWGAEPLGKEFFVTVFNSLRDLLCGDVLTIKGQPIAIEILYKIVGNRHIFVNYVNSGVDPEWKDFSPGSVLLFHNILQIETEAIHSQKELRFCCGRDDAPYKHAWCFTSPAFDSY
jgi:Mig-14